MALVSSTRIQRHPTQQHRTMVTFFSGLPFGRVLHHRSVLVQSGHRIWMPLASPSPDSILPFRTKMHLLLNGQQCRDIPCILCGSQNRYQAPSSTVAGCRI